MEAEEAAGAIIRHRMSFPGRVYSPDRMKMAFSIRSNALV